MQNLFRRPSGVWVARLAVPARLRLALGRHEFIQSTRSTDPAVGKLIGSALIAGWRRTLFNLDRSAGRIHMELEDETLLRIVDGSPALLGAEHLPLTSAASACGISVEELLRHVAADKLRLFARLAGSVGHVLPYDSLAVDDGELGTRIVPSPAHMPSSASRTLSNGVLALLLNDAQHAAGAWLEDPDAVLVFHLLDTGRPGLVFAHDDAPVLTLATVEVAVHDVERLRAVKAEGIAPQTAERARARALARAAPANPVAGLRNASRPLHESVEKYLNDAERDRGSEQEGRIRRACGIFLALMGAELTGSDLSRDLLMTFRDELLPTFPAEEAKLRLKYETGNLADSVSKAQEVGWPGMSAPQRVKHFGWLCAWVEWLGQAEWTKPGIADGLSVRGAAAVQVAKANKTAPRSDRRDPFAEDELRAVFGADWFRAGRGHLTKTGRFHKWSPFKTFVPLIGLLSGARLNEVCQLGLADLQQNRYGVWVFTITESEFDEDDDEDDDGDRPQAGTKRLKSLNARRVVPVHSELIRLGLIEYRDALIAAGRRRLFPELKYDENKGYGKAATRWFSGYLSGLGLPRNGRKVFHSFRHNVATALQNELNGRPLAVKQLLGHARGTTVTDRDYRGDLEVTGQDSELVQLIEGLHHDFLADLQPLDIQAGLQAVADALRRKDKGRGAAED